MSDYTTTLSTILDNNRKVLPGEVRRVLILYENPMFYIGDACVWFSRLSHLRRYFSHASIGINFKHKKHFDGYEALLRNNPNIDFRMAGDWDEIDIGTMDVLFLADYDEERFLGYLHERYSSVAGEPLRFSVFSISGIILSPKDDRKELFPRCAELEQFVAASEANVQTELYITDEERREADRWLESRGLQQGERLFVFLDSSSRRDKLLRVQVYFGLLQYVLSLENTKVLIYDEKDVGKEGFYREWVGEAGMEKLIFSRSSGLRKDICLIASHYTRLVFGPCTGLMHCALGAYNRFVREGMRVRNVPLMMVYTGLYPPVERNAAFWWDRSPLMNCLLIQDGGYGKEVITLDSLSDEEKADHVPYPCIDYTTDMLIGFLEQKLITRKIYT